MDENDSLSLSLYPSFFLFVFLFLSLSQGDGVLSVNAKGSESQLVSNILDEIKTLV